MLRRCHCQGHWKVLDLIEQGYRAECFVTLEKKIPTVPLKWCIAAKRTNSEHDRGHSMFWGTEVGKERTFSAPVFYCKGIPESDCDQDAKLTVGPIQVRRFQ